MARVRRPIGAPPGSEAFLRLVDAFWAEETFDVHSEAELKAYRSYPKLYKERKLQRKFTPQTLSFLDLPVELRLAIYEHALVLSEPFEFWPETGDDENDIDMRRANRKQLRNILRTRELNLGLLRTCKLVNEEAAEIFYGKNEFRFSGLYGHVSAAAFAYTIGPRHLQWLTNLTIGMPFHAAYNSHGFNALLGQSLFRYPSKGSKVVDKWVGPEAAFILLTQNLHHLRFSKNDEGYWDVYRDLVAARPSLRIQIVRILQENPDHGIWTDHWRLIRRMKTSGFCHILRAFPDNDGKWTLDPLTRVDKDGIFNHGTENTEMDANSDPMEILEDVWRLFEKR